MLDDIGYDGDSLDYQQLKQDNINHKVTSIGNLRGFTAAMAATPVDKKARRRMMRDPYTPKRLMNYRKPSTAAQEQLQDSIDWLNLNKQELPPELMTEGMKENMHSCEVSVGTVEDREADAAIADASLNDDRVGLYFVRPEGTWEMGEAVFTRLTSDTVLDSEPSANALETLRLLRTCGWPSTAASLYVSSIKAPRYAAHAAAQAKEGRWRGMQEFNGVTRAIEEEAAGTQLQAAKSGAVALPTLERLNALLNYDADTGALTWAVSRGRAAKGSPAYVVRKDGRLQTRVDGVDHYTARIVWMICTGEDPAANTVTLLGDMDDMRFSNMRLETTANNLEAKGSTARLYVGETIKYKAQLRVGKRMVHIGDFRYEEEATKARQLFIKTMRR